METGFWAENNRLVIEFLTDGAKLVDFWNEYTTKKTLVGIYTISDLIKRPDGKIDFNLADISLGSYGYENESSMLHEEINPDADAFDISEKELDWSK